MVCVSRSRLERGVLTQFCINVSRHRTGHFRPEKNPEMGQVPTSQARPRDTAHVRPSNLAATTPSLVEDTLFRFCRDPCPVRRGLVAAVKCLCAKKSVFFLCRQRTEITRHYRWHFTTDGTAREFLCDERKSCFVFLFSDPTTGLESGET